MYYVIYVLIYILLIILCIRLNEEVIHLIYHHKMELLEYRFIIGKNKSRLRCQREEHFINRDFLIYADLLCRSLIRFASSGFGINDEILAFCEDLNDRELRLRNINDLL